MPDTPETETSPRRSFTREIEVAGEDLIRRIRELAADSRVRRVRVIEPDGDIALEIPLAYGAIGAGAVVIAAPVLAVLGTLAALVAKVRIQITEAEPSAEVPPNEGGAP